MSINIGPPPIKSFKDDKDDPTIYKPMRNREELTCFIFEKEPMSMQASMVDEFLRAAVREGASDITIMSDSVPRLEINGVLYNATRRPWNSPECEQILVHLYNATNAKTEINALKELDFAYEIQMTSHTDRQRFRVNVTGAMGVNQHGIEISMRALPRTTPTKEGVGLTDDLVAAMMPQDGLVVMAGGTGHGKTTTLAAIIREHLLSFLHPKKIIDIQSPVEYTFRDVTSNLKNSSSLIVQMGIGVNISSYSSGIRASLRKKPSIICVGEARDAETIAAAIEGSLTGHLVYTTTHASSISETIQRLLSRFDGSERESKAMDLCSSLRFIMVQSLVERDDIVGRIAVREYLRITDRIRENLARMPLRDWAQYLTDEVNGKVAGTTPEDLRKSMRESAKEEFDQKRISRAKYMALSRLIRHSTEKNDADI